MRPLAVTRSLLAVLAAHVAAEHGSCPGGPASCDARDEEDAALLQLASAEPFVGGKFYCNPFEGTRCKNPPCHKVQVNVTGSLKERCSGRKVKVKYIDAIFGSSVKAIGFPKTPDNNVEKDIFEIPYCGGMEQVRYAQSIQPLVLYSASQHKVNDTAAKWSEFYTKAKWWVGEKTLSGLPGYKPFTTADYANEVAAVPWVPMTAIKCNFSQTDGFYIGSGAPRKTGATNLKDMCSEYNVKSPPVGLWKNFIHQLQDPDDEQLQIFMKSKSGHPHLPELDTCWLCDVSDTKVPMWDQMSCGSADRKTDPRCKGVKPCTWLQASNCKANDHVPCPVSGNMCSGNQCCPGVDASGGKTFPCPSASEPVTANCQTSVPISMCVG